MHSRERSPQNGRARACSELEPLEPRLLLDGTVIGVIPSLIDPATADQVVFAPGLSHHRIPNVDGPTSVLLSFVLDGPGFSDMPQFDLAPAVPGWGLGDAALALYDAGGNLLTTVDADGDVTMPAVETMLTGIENRQLYVLGIYFGAAPIMDYDLTATVGPQVPNTEIAIDPATGVGQLQAKSPEDTFNRPAEVDHYELGLLNAGAGGTVTVTPTGLNVQAFATLFRRGDATEPWQAIGTNSDAAGNPVALALTPPPQQSVTDGQYLLAVAPVGFNTAAGSYDIDVAAGPLLGPATVNPASATDLATPPPTTPGTAEAATAGSLAPGTAEMVKFLAPLTGEATLTLQADFQPVLSVYDETGADLLDVASRTTAGTVAMSLPVVAGTVYVVRGGDVDGNDGGGFELTISCPYSPQDLLLTGQETQVGPLPIGVDQVPQYFRLRPAFGADALVIGLAPAGGAGATVGLLGEDFAPLERVIVPGESLLWPIDLAGKSSPLDLYVAGTDADDVATLRIGQIDVPVQLDPGLLHDGKLGLDGDLAWTQSAGPFGSVSGVKAFQVMTDPAGTTVLFGDGRHGQVPAPATPMVAVYRQQGSMLRLMEYALPDELGKAEVQAKLPNEEMIGLAGISLGFDGSGDVEFSWDGPDLLGIGVGMVPEQVPDPNNPPTPPHNAVLKIRDEVLESDYEQHLWKTLLPFNILPAPTAGGPEITLTPKGGDLTATLTVLRADGSTFASVTNAPGQVGQISPAVATQAALYAIRGEALFFRVEPVAGATLGDGVYTIELTVETTNPMPFLMTETAWHFYVFGPPPPVDPGDVGDVNMLPQGETIVDIVQNQFGDGWAEGEFTSSAPHDDGAFGNTGSIDVYRFWAITPGPISVRTVGIDKDVNTNLKIYQARFDGPDKIRYLGQVEGVGPGLGDWFQADRSVIDDQTIVNDFDLLAYGPLNTEDQYGTNGGMYYVVVKNEQGTQGRYRIEVDVQSFPLLGSTEGGDYYDALEAQAAYIPPAVGGSVALVVPYVESIKEFVGYFPVQVPDYHDGVLDLLSDGSWWDYAVFDADGQPLGGSFGDERSGTKGVYTLPVGSQTVYVRIKERLENDNISQVNVSTDLSLPAGVAPPTPPPARSLSRMLPTTPMGAGGGSDSFVAAGQYRQFGFQVPAGPLTVDVMPAQTAILRFEAENFTSRATGADPDNPGVLQDWKIIDATADPGRAGDGEHPGEPGGAKFANASGGLYMQVVPDAGSGYNGAGAGQIDSGPRLEYEFDVPVDGRYNLQIRWDGHDYNSDSMYASIVELKDGIGGSSADWYRFSHNPHSDFDTAAFQGVAAFESTSYGGGDVDATWDLLAGQNYTLRLTPREDGVAVDAMRLVLVPDLELRWGVYVDGDLLAWEQTRMVGGDFAGSTSTTLILPRFRPPLATPQYAYDRAPYHDVVLYVEALTTPAESREFTILVNGAGQLPMRNAELTIPPNVMSASATLEFTKGLDGTDWVRLDVPYGIAGDVTLRVDLAGTWLFRTLFRYDLYRTDGSFVSSQSLLSSSLTPGTMIFNLTGATGGESYYLCAGMAGNTDIRVRLTASATLPKANAHLYRVPPATRALLGEKMERRGLKPDGTMGGTVVQPYDQPLSILISESFWAGTPGLATFRMKVSNLSWGYLALYRGVADYAGEQTNYDLELVDYVNGADVVNGDEYKFTAYVEPGMYVLKAGGRPSSGMEDPTFSVDVPDFVPREVVIDPNSGMSTDANYYAIDTTRDGFGMYESQRFDAYRTTVFHVVVPAASQAGMGAVATTQLDSSLFPTTGFPSVHENGTAGLRVYWWHDIWGTYIGIGDGFGDEDLDPPGTTLISLALDSVEPFGEYWFSLRRDFLNDRDKIGVGAQFVVPQSGTPDLIVDPLILSPNKGQTLVGVTVRNIGFASTTFFSSRFQYTDSTKIPTHLTVSDILELPMGPLSSRYRALDWITPQLPADRTTYKADFVGPTVPEGAVEELDETNNSATEILSTVDPHRPTLSMVLTDPQLDGNRDPLIWGRYISRVPGVQGKIVATSEDPDGDLYVLRGRYPQPSPPAESQIGQYFTSGLDGSHTVTTVHGHYDFGSLLPTTPQNTNTFRLIAYDEYGLPSAQALRIVQVLPKPAWLDTAESKLTYDPATREYVLAFRNSLIRVEGSINDLLEYYNYGPPSEIMFIGELDNLLLAEVMAKGRASLDPSNDFSAAISAHLQLKLFDADIFDKTFYGADPPSYNASREVFITTSLSVDGLTLENEELNVDGVAIRFDVFNKELIAESGEAVLFAYGIPDVIGINAKFKYDLKANLIGRMSVVMPTQPPHYPALMAPTFIGVPFSASAAITGTVELFGFDVAAIEGKFSTSITPAYGLTVTGGQVVPFGDFFENASFGIAGNVKAKIAATILGIEVWSYGPDPLSWDYGGVVTQAGGDPDFPNVVTVFGGGEPVGLIETDPRPNIVIDPAGGEAMFVQLVDVDPDVNVTRNNLAFSRRQGLLWGGLTEIPDANSHLSNPALALTHDAPGGPGAPAVVVYQALAAVNDPADRTRNQFFAGQDIRWRYFDGSTWQGEQSLTSDALYDSEPVVAFNSTGAGVTAWTHNTDTTPIGADGAFNRQANEIQVAAWDPGLHNWQAPQTLTADAVADGRPAVFADEDGTLYVLWLRDTVGGNEVMYSTNSGAGWSSPVVLSITAVPEGGKVADVAIGSRGPGRIDVLLAHARQLTDGSVESRLYNRPSTATGFALPTAVEIVAENAGFSHLRTVRAADDGALVAYWQQSDGVTNEVFASRIGPLGAGPATWSKPMRLTSSEDLEITPSLAVDVDGTYQVVYEKRETPLVITPSVQADPAVGVPTAGSVGTSHVELLPELSFSREMAFEGADAAPSGTESVATARIVNRGPAGDDVLIEYLEDSIATGGPTLVGSDTISLAAGSEYEVAHSFAVAAGPATYSIRLTVLGGAEVVGDADNVASAEIEGLPDLTVVFVALPNPRPQAGETVSVVSRVTNLSNLPIGAFSVKLFEGDPTVEYLPSTLVDTQPIAGLAPGESIKVVSSWTVPAEGGGFLLTSLADADEAIDEAIEFNNAGRVLVTARADAVVDQAVTASVFRYTGVDNVQVFADVRNDGFAGLTDVPAQLLWSWDDGEFRDVGTINIPSLPAGDTVQVQWLAPGWAGENRYLVVVDPAMAQPETNRTNNFAQTLLTLQGLPDVEVSGAHLDTPAPVQYAPARVLADVRNLGIATARNVLVEVYATVHGGGRRFIAGRTVIDAIDPLSDTVVAIDIDTSELIGAVQISVVADRLQHILEITDHNNEDMFLVTFEPDITPPAVSALGLDSTAWTMGTVDSSVWTTGRDAQTVPWSIVDRLVMTFDEPVIATAGDLSLTGVDSGVRVPSAATGSGTTTVTWTLTPVGQYLGTDRYTVVLHEGVTDLAGNALAGGWTADLNVLVGDINGDGRVSSRDRRDQHDAFGSAVGSTRYTLLADLNGDGRVSSRDRRALRDNYGPALPDLPALPAATAASPLGEMDTDSPPPVPARIPSDVKDALARAAMVTAAGTPVTIQRAQEELFRVAEQAAQFALPQAPSTGPTGLQVVPKPSSSSAKSEDRTPAIVTDISVDGTASQLELALEIELVKTLGEPLVSTEFRD